MILDDTPVEAFDISTGKSVGTFPSLAKAARSLFIRNPSSVFYSVNPFYKRHPKKQRKKRGVLSYKDGKRYTFKYANKI